jgi:hypothetical protein
MGTMTAARTCASCGSELSGDVRWCVRCYAPIRELTPRAPVWVPGEFVDGPIVTNGAVPHWSRWEKSQTTFGPFGRITITVVTLLWLLAAVGHSPITAVFMLPLSVVIIRSVWQAGWVVPSHEAALAAPAAHEPDSKWLWDRSDVIGSLVLAAAWAAAIAILLYVDDPIARFIVVLSGVVTAAAWAFHKVAGGR